MKDDPESMQAECVVRALDAYLATLPWPAPTVQSISSIEANQQACSRKFLVDTLAASFRMSEPRISEFQKSTI